VEPFSGGLVPNPLSFFNLNRGTLWWSAARLVPNPLSIFNLNSRTLWWSAARLVPNPLSFINLNSRTLWWSAARFVPNPLSFINLNSGTLWWSAVRLVFTEHCYLSPPLKNYVMKCHIYVHVPQSTPIVAPPNPTVTKGLIIC